MTITVGVLSFLLFIMYASLFSFASWMRLEVLGGYLVPGSKSQVNQQVLISQVNRFFLEVARNVRSAAQVEVVNPSRVRITKGANSVVEYYLDYPFGGAAVKAIVRSGSSQARHVVVQSVEDFKVEKTSNLVTFEIKAIVAGKEQVFRGSFLQRNSS